MTQGAPDGVKKRKALKPMDPALLGRAADLLSEELSQIRASRQPTSASDESEAWAHAESSLVYGAQRTPSSNARHGPAY